MKLRVGRKVGRTLYLQRGPEPSDDDQLVGMMDSRELAARVAAGQEALTALAQAVVRHEEAAVSTEHHLDWHSDCRHCRAQAEMMSLAIAALVDEPAL